jgi:uncharacterized protein (DUF302 family)
LRRTGAISVKEIAMTYYLAKLLQDDFATAIGRVKEALKGQGFGVLTEINIQATLKDKIGADYPAYTILGACNPALAYEALQLENKVGTMLPCNVVVRDNGDGHIEVAAIDPVASMLAIDNAALKLAAKAVRDRLKNVIDGL